MTQNKTVTIFNKTFNAENICTINYSGDKLAAQRSLGMNVVYPNDEAKKYIAQIYGKAGSVTTECIIINGKPSKFLSNILSNIYWANEIQEVYDKSLRKVVRYNDPNKTYKYIYYKIDGDYFKFIPNDKKDSSYYNKIDKNRRVKEAKNIQIDTMYNGMRIPEERKAKMRRYIKYYDLDYPETEPEWVEMFHQLAYYIKNNIGYKEPEYTPEEQALIDSYQMDKEITYGFDNNQYYICEECGELINRGSEELHCCYCDIPTPMTKIDYIVNGDE